MTDVFKRLKNALDQAGKHPVAATVVSVDSLKMTADVRIEGEEVIREAVPLRIFTDDDNLGAVIVPRVDSEVIIAYLDGNEDRPQIIKVQQWEFIIARRGDGDTFLEFVVDSENKVSLKLGNEFEALIEQNAYLKVKNGSKYELDMAADGKISITSEKDLEVSCVNAQIKASGNIDLGEGGAGVMTAGPGGKMPVCYVTGAAMPCSATVKAKG